MYIYLEIKKTKYMYYEVGSPFLKLSRASKRLKLPQSASAFGQIHRSPSGLTGERPGAVGLSDVVNVSIELGFQVK